MSDMRTPLSQARGLGSAKSGTHHWIMQRITAVALVPLGLWLAASLACLAGADFLAVREWVAAPFNTVALILFFAAGFYHSELGLQTIVEDYVHSESLKVITLLVLKFIHIVLAAAVIVAVLRISLGG